MKRAIGCVLAGLAMFGATLPASANDSSAELALGGLVLRQSTNITMKSEDLFISRERIRVRYVYRNNSARPVTTIVAFPLPDVDYGVSRDEDYQTFVTNTDDGNVIAFRTLVDGRPVQFNTELRAFIGNREITQRLRDLGLPLLLTTLSVNNRFLERVTALSPAARNVLVREGLIEDTGSSDGRFKPRWRTTINVWRNQTFPAGRDVNVEHSYAPILGGSVGSSLAREYRADSMARYSRDYCVDNNVLAGIDRRLSATNPRVTMIESWLGYVLKSGANWSGPIGRFTLTIDKGKTDDIVSFCETGVRRISPTQFQVTKTNFKPERDLKVLFVFFPPIPE